MFPGKVWGELAFRLPVLAPGSKRLASYENSDENKGKEYYPSFTCYESALVCYGGDGLVEASMEKQTVVMHSMDCLSEAKFNLEEYVWPDYSEDCAIVLLNTEQRLDPILKGV